MFFLRFRQFPSGWEVRAEETYRSVWVRSFATAVFRHHTAWFGAVARSPTPILLRVGSARFASSENPTYGFGGYLFYRDSENPTVRGSEFDSEQTEPDVGRNRKQPRSICDILQSIYIYYNILRSIYYILVRRTGIYFPLKLVPKSKMAQPTNRPYF